MFRTICIGLLNLSMNLFIRLKIIGILSMVFKFIIILRKNHGKVHQGMIVACEFHWVF